LQRNGYNPHGENHKIETDAKNFTLGRGHGYYFISDPENSPTILEMRTLGLLGDQVSHLRAHCKVLAGTGEQLAGFTKGFLS
jgi:hypothetical protein